MPLPPAAEAARLAAVRSQSRRNMGGAMLVGCFVVGVFSYCIRSVEQEEISERDLKEFIRRREIQKQREGQR